MEKIITKGQLVFGAAISVFGVENLICARLGLTVRGVPWFPANPYWGYLTGMALLVAGLSIAANVRARRILDCRLARAAAPPAQYQIAMVFAERKVSEMGGGEAFRCGVRRPRRRFRFDREE